MAGGLISIGLNPLLFRQLGNMEGWIRRAPVLAEFRKLSKTVDETELWCMLMRELVATIRLGGLGARVEICVAVVGVADLLRRGA